MKELIARLLGVVPLSIEDIANKKGMRITFKIDVYRGSNMQTSFMSYPEAMQFLSKFHDI